jgi:hypothetical protein
MNLKHNFVNKPCNVPFSNSLPNENACMNEKLQLVPIKSMLTIVVAIANTLLTWSTCQRGIHMCLLVAIK